MMASKTKPDTTCKSLTLANLFGLTTVRIQQLAKQGIVHKTDRGLYNFTASVQGYIRYLQERSAGRKQEDIDADTGTGRDAKDLTAQRIRLTRAKADAAEIEAGILAGTVHEADAIRAIWADMIGNAKARLMALPVKCAGDIRDLVARNVPPEVLSEIDLVAVRETLTDSCREALSELADYDASQLVANFVERHRDPVDAAPESDDEPVGRRKPAP